MPQQSETQSQPAGARFLGLIGWVVPLLVIAYFLLFAVATLTPKPKANGIVIVNDEANLLAPWAEEAIGQIKFPDDVPVVVHTVSTIPAGKIATFATDKMSQESHWQTLRPRGWLRKYIKRDFPWATGVYVVVSLDPQLLQIRFGEEIRLGAYQQMIAVGPWYRDQQRFERTEVDHHVLNTVKELAPRMKNLAHPPWPLSWAQHLSSLVASEIDDMLAPSNDLFSKLVLKNYIAFAHTIGATGSAWRFVAFNVAAFVLLWLLGKRLLIKWFLLPRIRSPWLRWPLLILSNLAILGVLVTGFISLAVLSKGRIEDELALHALGLPFLSTAGLDVGLFSVQGGLWLAIPGALIVFLGELMQSSAAAKHGETRITFGWLLWGCMLFLLPKAIGIPVLVMRIWNTGSEIVQSMSEDSTVENEKILGES